jgi:hypothetical protein
MVILLLDINGYYISDYYCLLITILLWILMFINGYYISEY